MNARIFRFIILLLISVVCLPAVGKTPEQDARERGDLGIYLSADAFGYLYPIFVKDRFYSSELSATLNINNRFMPVVEVGFGHADMVSQLYSIGYRTRAPYYRVGMDYNVQYKKGGPGYIYLGARVGYTAFHYSVDAPPLVDPVWGDEAPVQFTDVPCSVVWGEVVGGVRAEIARNFCMGWSLRYKLPFHRAGIVNGGPWYVPGYGARSKGVLGATYTMSYYFKLR